MQLSRLLATWEAEWSEFRLTCECAQQAEILSADKAIGFASGLNLRYAKSAWR